MRMREQVEEHIREVFAVELQLVCKANLIQQVRQARLEVIMHERKKAPYGLRLPKHASAGRSEELSGNSAAMEGHKLDPLVRADERGYLRAGLHA